MTRTSTDKAIRLIRPGGPKELAVVDWPAEPPGPSEIRLRHEAIGPMRSLTFAHPSVMV